jgi:hypothetical protein
VEPGEHDGDGLAPPGGSIVRGVVKFFLSIFAAMVVLSVLWFLSGTLTSFTLRVIVGLVLALIAASIGVSYFRQVGNPPPPDPEPTVVSPGLHLAYVCEMCGLELAVLKVARDRAPRHCGEAMQLVRKGPPAELN